MEESFLQTILHPDDQDETIALCVGATARGEDQELEYRAVAADGRTVWMRDRVRVIKDETGRPVLLRGIMVDITASKNAEGENKALEAQLRQAQKMEAVGQLAGGIAHDFNNLLTVINGYAEILKLKLANTDALGRYADDIFSAGERAARLTHQLLAFSRKQVLTPTVLDLNELLTGTQSLLKRLIGETIEIDLHLDDRPCPARVDEGQIQQVVMNLAVNARDAMPHGGTIVLSTRNTTAEEVAEDWPNMKPGRYVRISLEDNGVGMAPNIVEQVFEPFFTTKPRGEGTGLGLSTAYGIIKQSGGYIWADSHPGRGTRFDVFLPCSSQPIEPATSAPPQADSAARRTVLLVEDDDLVRELASEVLEDDGFEVHGATNGREALDLADRLENFDVLITDLVMPHVDGVALSKRIRKTRPRLPVVVMSGYPDRARVVDSVGLGECVFLNKPFTRDKLLSTLRDLFSALDTPKQVH
jgi:signal transduction histidine kinase/ActR/RegA family two-component response regulator